MKLQHKLARYRVYVWDRWHKEKTGLDTLYTQRGPAEAVATAINNACPNMEAEVRTERDYEE